MMKRLCLIVSFPLLVSSTLAAQTIHGAPQGVTQYTDPSQWPFISGQCHWAPERLDPLDLTLGHTHIEASVPIWGELGGAPITVPVTVRLFRTAGKIVNVWADHAGDHTNDVIWDRLPDGTIPTFPLQGDPNGLKTWTGHVILDPFGDYKDGVGGFPAHGTFGERFYARTVFDNGDQMSYALLSVPMYSVIDPTQPEVAPPGGSSFFRASCTPFSPGTTPDGSNGSGIVEVPTGQTLPIFAPIAEPVTVSTNAYNYGPNEVPPSVYELRLDSDLHMNVPGVLLVQNTIPFDDKGTFNSDTIDPAVLAASTPPMGFTPGWHRLSFTWKNESGKGGVNSGGYTVPPNETMVALLVVKVKVDPSVAPVAMFPPPPIILAAVHPDQPPPPPMMPPPVTPPPPPVAGTAQVPIFGLEDTLDGVGQGTFHECVKDVMHCKPF